jgi:hypothetical protein
VIGAVLAVVCPRLAPSRALVARYDALAARLHDEGGRGLVLLAQIGPVAREIERRGLWPMTRRYWAGPGI